MAHGAHVTSDLIPTRVAAEILGCSVSTVSRLVAAGKLQPAIRIDGLRGAMFFPRDAVHALADSLPQDGAA